MKFIPRRSRIRAEIYKNITFLDIGVALVGAVIAVLIFSANIPFSVYIGLSFMAFWVMLFIPIADGVKLYASVFLIFKFLAYNKNYYKDFKKRTQDIRRVVPFMGVTMDKYINYGNYFAQVIEVQPVDLFLMEQDRQEMVIRTFANAFQRLTKTQKMTIIKTRKPMIFDQKLKLEDYKFGEVQKMEDNGYMTAKEVEARSPVFQERIGAIKFLNEQEKVLQEHFYLVIFDEYKDTLDSTVLGIAASLNSGVTPLTSEVITGDELYSFMKSTFVENFDERELDIVLPNDKAKWAMPDSIKFKIFSTEVDGKSYRTFTITDYPIEVPNAWLYPIFALDNCKVTVNVELMDRIKAEKMLDKSLMEIESKLNKAARSSKQIENQTQYDTLKQLLTSLKNNNENLFDVNVHIMAESGMKKEVRAVLKQQGFKFAENFGRQIDAFVSANVSKLDTLRSYRRSIHTTSLAACFPMVSSNLIDDRGFYIGMSSASGLPVFADFFVRNDARVNSNMVILGKSGSGKSFATKTLLANMAADNTRVFILDPEDEYRILCKNLGGKTIDVGSSTSGIFNPFHIFTSLKSDEGEDDDSYNAHLQFLEQFLKLVMQGISADAFEELNAIIVELYRNFNITPNTDLSKLEPKDYPIFDDLMALINQKIEAETDEYHKRNLQAIQIYVSKFATGGRNSNLWNGHTSVDTNENFICFNFRSLLNSGNDIIAIAQMLIVFKYLNNEIMKNKDFNDKYYAHKMRLKNVPEDEFRRIIVTVDEAHVFINKKYPAALDFMAQMAKRIRKYKGMQIIATQNIKDFVGSEEIAQQSTAVINASQYSLIFSLAPNDITDLINLYRNAGGINKDEQDSIVAAGRGECFLISSAINRTFVRIDALNTVRDLFEHDPDTDKEEKQF